MTDQPVVNMITAITRQIEERHERGELNFDRDLATLELQGKSAKELGDAKLEGDIHSLIGKILLSTGVDMPAALNHLSTARDLYENSNKPAQVATATMMIGSWYNTNRQPEEAVSHIETAIALATRVGGPRLVSTAKTYLADVHEALGNYDQAIALYSEAGGMLSGASITRRRGELMLQIEYGLGSCHFMKGDFDAAWEVASRLYQLSTAYADVTYQIKSAGLLARLLMANPREHDRTVMNYIREAYMLIEQKNRYFEYNTIRDIEAEYLHTGGNYSD